jgi:hypothetical protein
MNEVERFYEWLLKIKSIHLADNEQMSKAYTIVYQNSINDLKTKKCTQSI